MAVDPADPHTVVFTLTRPASYFIAMLSLTAFSPAPVEYDQYIPAGPDLAQHTISDGPYEVTSYTAAKEIDFDRNPAWDASTDPIRKAYVDKVVVNETGDQTAIQAQLQANTAGADMEWDTFPPVSQVTQLKASKDPNFYLGPTFSSNPYIVFNTVSPNNGGALGKVAGPQGARRSDQPRQPDSGRQRPGRFAAADARVARKGFRAPRATRASTCTSTTRPRRRPISPRPGHPV